MQYKVIFYDITTKWEDELTSSASLTCKDAARLVLERKGEKNGTLEDAVFLMDNKSVQADVILPDGACLYVFRLIGGG